MSAPEDDTDREPVAATAGGNEIGPIARADARMADFREDDTRRRIALAVSVSIGLAAATVHWLGLVLAGVLVGLTRRRPVGAVAAGLSFGVLTVVLTVAVAPAVGPGEFVALTPLNYLTVVLALVLPVWGGMARYVL